MAVPRADRQEKKGQTKGELKRLQFDFPVPAVQVLQELAALTGEPTLAGVVRDALKVYTWLIEEQKHEDIAAALGISIGAVKSRVFRAVRILRGKLERMGIEP